MQTTATTCSTPRAPASRLRRLTARGATLLAVAGVAATVTTAAVAASAPTSAADKALFAYAKCMRGKGVKIPDPARGKDGRYAFGAIPTSVTGAAGVREKAQACAATSGAQRASNGSGQTGGGPGGGPGGFRGGQQTPGQQAAFKKFQDCLKANGATTPAPGQRPQRPAPTTSSATKKPGTTTTATVTDPKTGKPLTRPSLLGQGSGANDDGAGRGGGRGGFGGRGGGGDAKTQAAFAKCRSLLPSRPGGVGGPPAAGTRTASK